MYKKFYEEFIDYGFDEYIKTFKDFFYNDSENYHRKLKLLKDNLDPQSIYHVDRFLQLMNKLPLPSKDFLVRRSSIYKQRELSQMLEENKYKENVLQEYYQKYKLEGWEKLEVNVFKYHCGLKKISSKVNDYIKNTIFIDGGAFWGDSALMLKKYLPKKIICFEPNSVNYQKLQQVVLLNNSDSLIDCVNFGLSDIEETKIMNYLSDRQNHGASLVFKAKKHKNEMVKLLSLDRYLEKEKQRIGFIKIDVEGYGLPAILGSKNTIINNSPVLSCAIYHNPEEFFDILTILKSYNPNYKFIITPLSQGFILKEMTLLAY